MVRPDPSANVGGCPQITPSPPIDRRREVRATAELVGTLLAHTEKLADFDEAEELAVRHRLETCPTLIGTRPEATRELWLEVTDNAAHTTMQTKWGIDDGNTTE